MQPVIGELDMITDGEKAGGDGYFVELGPTPQWVQIDLGASRPLYAILAWHYHSQARVYRDVIVQVSDDPAFKTGVTTVFNNDHDNSAKLGRREGQGVHRGRRGQAVRPEGREGPVRPALLEREHDERPDPLRRSRGLRPAEMTRAGARRPRRDRTDGRAGAAPGPARRAADAPRRGEPGGQVRRAARARRVPLRRARPPRPDALLPDAAGRVAARPGARSRRSTNARSAA